MSNIRYLHGDEYYLTSNQRLLPFTYSIRRILAQQSPLIESPQLSVMMMRREDIDNADFGKKLNALAGMGNQGSKHRDSVRTRMTHNLNMYSFFRESRLNFPHTYNMTDEDAIEIREVHNRENVQEVSRNYQKEIRPALKTLSGSYRDKGHIFDEPLLQHMYAEHLLNDEEMVEARDKLEHSAFFPPEFQKAFEQADFPIAHALDKGYLFKELGKIEEALESMLKAEQLLQQYDSNEQKVVSTISRLNVLYLKAEL